MNNHDQTAVLARLEGLGAPAQLWPGSDFPAGDQPGDVASGLVSLAFLRAAIMRGMRLWCALAIAGLIAGLGLYAAFPPAYQASASVLLTLGPYENANSAAMDNQAIAQSRTVAGLATRMLGLRQDAGGLLAEYTAAIVSPRVLQITVSAPSSKDAVRRANAVATAFLRFRAGQLEADQRLAEQSIDEKVSQARQQVRAISRQISLLPPQPTSPVQQAQLSRLRQQQSQAVATLAALQQSAGSTRASTATTLAVKGSVILDSATPIKHSRLKRLLPRPAVGLALGLALGLGIVVIQALSSDTLRRRDDIATALGAPVRLSVGEVRHSRWLPSRHGLAAASGADVQRIATYLRGAVPAGTRGPAALVIVPLGKPQAAALSVVSLAISCARQGKNVVVADLIAGAPAARLLQAAEPGTRSVSLQDVQLVVAVPEPGQVAPVGPFGRGLPGTQPSPFTSEVAGACGSADLLLTLAAPDPALTADNLPTWATAAVVVVTAGQSSWSQLHAAGQLMRLAGLPPSSAVLVGADKHDETIGLYGIPGTAAPASQGAGGISR